MTKVPLCAFLKRIFTLIIFSYNINLDRTDWSRYLEANRTFCHNLSYCMDTSTIFVSWWGNFWIFCLLFKRLMKFVFLCLAYFIMTFFRPIHIAANGIISFFLWLNNISLCICTTSSLFLCWWTFRLLPYPGYYK